MVHISGMMDDSGIGKEYADDFIQFIRICSVNRFDGMRIRDWLRHRLSSLSAKNLGLKSSALNLGQGKRFNPLRCSIVQGFSFSGIRGQYDLIILYAVVEHDEIRAHSFRGRETSAPMEKLHYLCRIASRMPQSGDIASLPNTGTTIPGIL